MAAYLVRLTLNMAHYRVNSMSWHSEEWPGLLALLVDTGDVGSDFRHFWEFLHDDFSTYNAALKEMLRTLFVRSALAKSAFGLVVMAEIACMFFLSPDLCHMAD